jgi:hypothetical protein
MVCARPPNFPKDPCGGWKSPLLAGLRAMGSLYPSKQWFHLKELYKFIEAHWEVLRPSLLQTKEAKEWHKQLQDVLSHNKHLFLSARGLIGKNGYWRLVEWGECLTFDDNSSEESIKEKKRQRNFFPSEDSDDTSGGDSPSQKRYMRDDSIRSDSPSESPPRGSPVSSPGGSPLRNSSPQESSIIHANSIPIKVQVIETKNSRQMRTDPATTSIVDFSNEDRMKAAHKDALEVLKARFMTFQPRK